MAALDHWHPVLSTKALRDKPVGIKLAGQDIVLFRAERGKIGALADACVHRRMRLSRGFMDGCRLRCLYHGWAYDSDGNGESPGSPKMHAQTQTFDAVDKHGVIWVKSHDSNPLFPPFDNPGYFHLSTLFHKVNAPLEVTVDNFCEIEHTPTTHAIFGYPLERMHEVEVRYETTDTSVRVINHGPPKRLNPILSLLIGVGKDYQFNDDWTTYFSPVYSIYEHWWSCPKTNKESMVRWRLYIFFTPIDDAHTALTTFTFTKSRYPGPAGGMRLFRWLMVNNLDYEIGLDVNIIENLADKSPSLEGMKLSRFDRSLGLNRERIDKVYRGRTTGAVIQEAMTNGNR